MTMSRDSELVPREENILSLNTKRSAGHIYYGKYDKSRCQEVLGMRGHVEVWIMPDIKT